MTRTVRPYMESEVIAFVAEQTGVEIGKITPHTLINDDLGVEEMMGQSS